jgi:glyoxylate reductase
LTRPKVFVLQPIMDVALDALKDFAEVEVFESDRMISKLELLDGVQRCDYLFALGASTIDDEILDANPDLKGIATMGLWADPEFVRAATKRKIPVTIIPHLITKTTADLTVALVIGVAWRIVEADRFTRAGRFRQNQSTSFLTTELGGKKVGIIGLGDIGKEVAKRLRAFEMEISYTKRNRLPIEEEEALGVTWVAERDDLLRESDFVVIMTTYNDSTHKFIGKREFELMKPTGFFINSARGRIVDEPALIEALTCQSGALQVR